MGRCVRAGLVAGIATLAVAVPSSASGATILGGTPPPRGSLGNCQAGITDGLVVQPAAAGINYTVPPGGGVITEWSHLAGPSPGQSLALRVFTRQDATTFTAVNGSAQTPITPSQLNVFPTRISVSGGEILGLRNGPLGSDNTACLYLATGDAQDQAYFLTPGPPIGTPGAYVPLPQYLVNVAVRLEADSDDDGFGDETQDDCPTDASTQGACPGPGTGTDTVPPETTITKGAPNKLDKHKVKFKFESSEPGSSFECKFDKKGFKPCSSPRKYKRLDDGKHKFEVFAIDAAGNEGSAAKDKFKVVD
jgi:hypothetical protein